MRLNKKTLYFNIFYYKKINNKLTKIEIEIYLQKKVL